MDHKKDIRWRMYTLYFLACVFAVAILVKVFQIQVVEGEEWANRASKEKYAMRTIPAARGKIYAEDGSLLATSVPIYKVHVDLNAEAITDELYREKGDSLARACANLFAFDNVEFNRLYDRYKKRFDKARREGKRYTRISTKVRYDQLQLIKKFPILNRGRYKGGLIIERYNKRQLPFEMLAHRTIGYDRDSTKVGLEGAYDMELSGVDGKRLMKKISGGVWMPVNDDNEVKPDDGMDIYTTINISYQDYTEQALLRQLKRDGASHGCAVLMEVETGYVKAIANLTRHKDGSYFEDYNYAVGASTEPGSTFKLLSLMSALDHGLTEISDEVDCGNGKHKFYDVVMHDSKRGGYGVIPVKDAFAFSSNIGIAKVVEKGYKEQQRKFTDKLHLMGASKKLGLEISGEGKPLIKNAGEDNWSGISITQMAIGYELQMTPLQTLTVYNAIANNGRVMRPTFVREIRKDNKLVRKVEPVVLNEAICSQETVKDLQECLKAVVDYGTGKSLQTRKFNFAGKTGTARISKGSEGYVNTGVEGQTHSYLASFVGYFPAEKPKYSLIVVISAPTQGRYYGASVAGPAWKEIAEKVYASCLELHDPIDHQNEMALHNRPVSKHGYQSDLQRVFAELDVPMNIVDPEAEFVTTATTNDEVVMREQAQAEMPDVVGMGLMDAIFLIESKGKRVKVKGSGVVRKQYVRPNEPEIVVLELS